MAKIITKTKQPIKKAAPKKKTSSRKKPIQKTKALIVQNTDPGSLLQLAIQQNMDMEKLSQLLDIYQKWEAGKAKKKYFEALAKFQSECPEIQKTKHIKYKTKSGYVVDYWYEPLNGIISQVKKLLEECGFSYSFTQDQEDVGCIKITCSLHHKDGHTETAPLKAHADGSGNKNAIQSIASTVTYLRRYTFCGITGITTADTDDDGQSYESVIKKTKENNIEDVQIIEENEKEIEDELKSIMNTEYFTIQEKEKFKVWLPANTNIKVRIAKLDFLRKELEKRKNKGVSNVY